MFIRKFEILGTVVVPEKSLAKTFIGENGQIKGMVIMRMLILSYTIQQVIANVCNKFQSPRCSSSWEIFDEKKNKTVYTQTHRQTDKHCYGKDKNDIPPYTSYAAGIKTMKIWRLPLEIKKTQKNENRRLDFIKSLHIYQCNLRGCIRLIAPPTTPHPGS